MNDYAAKYNVDAHLQLKGYARFKNRTFKYNPGKLTWYLAEQKRFPERIQADDWCNCLLEFFESRAIVHPHPYFRIPDDIWFAVCRYLDAAMAVKKTGIIELEALRGFIDHSVYLSAIDWESSQEPVLYDVSREELHRKGIDSLLVNHHEIEGKMHYYPKGKGEYTFYYRKGKFEQFVLKENRLPETFFAFADVYMEMLERHEKGLSRHACTFPDALVQFFFTFLEQCITAAATKEINIHDTENVALVGTGKNSFPIIKNPVSEPHAAPIGEKRIMVNSSAGYRADKIDMAACEKMDTGSIDKTFVETPDSMQHRAWSNDSEPIVKGAGQQNVYDAETEIKRLPAADNRAPADTPMAYMKEYLGPDNDGSKAGERIGSGTAMMKIGSGGMAHVYKIRSENLDVIRAVKVINMSMVPEMHRQNFSERLLTEAQISAKLQHPYIVEVYDIGKWRELPFIEMQYIDGADLDKWIERSGRIPTVVTCAVGILICEALLYAHNQKIEIYGQEYCGVAHRDLKPANIMLSQEGIVKLMDFGIARPFQQGFHTMTGHGVGSIQYSAFEQIGGNTVDARSDLYALGVVLYEMLTGKKVFPQKEFNIMMRFRALNKYKPLSDFNLKIPRVLADTVHRCLQLDPEDRPKSAAAVLEFLNHAFYKLTREQASGVVQDWVYNGQKVDDFSKSIFLRKRQGDRKSLWQNIFGIR